MGGLRTREFRVPISGEWRAGAGQFVLLLLMEQWSQGWDPGMCSVVLRCDALRCSGPVPPVGAFAIAGPGEVAVRKCLAWRLASCGVATLASLAKSGVPFHDPSLSLAPGPGSPSLPCLPFSI